MKYGKLARDVQNLNGAIAYAIIGIVALEVIAWMQGRDIMKLEDRASVTDARLQMLERRSWASELSQDTRSLYDCAAEAEPAVDSTE